MKSLKLLFFVPLSIALLFILTFIILGSSWLKNQTSIQVISDEIANVEKVFQLQLKQESTVMTTLLKLLTSDQNIIDSTDLRNAWLNRDREKLLNLTQGLYQLLNREYGITHFYFSTPDRVNFLRVHNPKKHGDIINRFTTTQSQTTAKPYFGIELGPYGTFTLRQVFPWFHEGKLIGYLELGKEIDNIFIDLHQSLNVDLLAVIDKQYLNKQSWTNGMVLMGRDSNWDRFPNLAVITQTLPDLPTYLTKLFSDVKLLTQLKDIDYQIANQSYYTAFIPLRDASGIQVGSLAVIINETSIVTANSDFTRWIVFICLLTASIILSFFYLLLSNIERKIQTSQDELVDSKQLAVEALKTKSEFLASMSHEIRTPMNGVLGMLGLLLKTTLTSEQQHRAEIAQISAKSLLKLINDILDFSKIEADKLELELLPFDLRLMMDQFAESMAQRAQNKNLELILNIIEVNESEIIADPGRIRQIFTNLVSNAIKFTEKGEIIINVSLRSFDKEHWKLIFSVTDSGIGIPKEKQSVLFQSFRQVDASTTRQFGGTGLGLAIAKKLCTKMSGYLSVDSTIGIGSCFSGELLVKKSKGSTVVMPQSDISQLNILIVDDNETNLDILRGQLNLWGANIVEASSGNQALLLCEERFEAPDKAMFDIAILDMQMPAMDGAQLGQKLHQDYRFVSIKLVMMTSMNFHGDAREMAKLGFSGYFPKPVTTTNLFNTLNVIAENGEALAMARPLITQHYLQTLQTTDQIKWPLDCLILVVEDNQINQMVIADLLSDLGLTSIIAGNGVEALQILNQMPDDSQYSLILMDCQMPQMDGYEATRKIRSGTAKKINKNIPIIAMTANAMQGDKEKCLESGMDDYMSKPIDPALVQKMLKKWLLGQKNDSNLIEEPRLKAENSMQQPSCVLVQTENHDIELDKVIWDKAALLNRVRGKEQFVNKLVEIYIVSSRERFNQLQQAIAERDVEQIQLVAHTIKGVAANLSGLRVQYLSLQIEKAAKADDLNLIKPLFQKLKTADLDLLQAFKRKGM